MVDVVAVEQDEQDEHAVVDLIDRQCIQGRVIIRIDPELTENMGKGGVLEGVQGALVGEIERLFDDGGLSDMVRIRAGLVGLWVVEDVPLSVVARPCRRSLGSRSVELAGEAADRMYTWPVPR